MHRVRWWVIALGLGFVSMSAYGRRAAADDASMQHALAAGRQAMLERHYRQAARILGDGIKAHPQSTELRLELGRALSSSGEDKQAIRLFREIISAEPDNREAKLELARVLSHGRRYRESDEIFQRLLDVNTSDEAAAIGLASNLLHERRSPEAQRVIENALLFHPNSLRLQEYKDRIESGRLGGDDPAIAVVRNIVEGSGEYLSDSAGNRSWQALERMDLGITGSLTDRIVLEQDFLRGQRDASDGDDVPVQDQTVAVFSNELRWKPQEWLLLSTGGGAVRFDGGETDAVYDASLNVQPRSNLVLGFAFFRVPIIPDAKAAEFHLTSQGPQMFLNWTPQRWQFNARWSRQNYSDENIGSRQGAEVLRDFGPTELTLTLGYRYRRASFDVNPSHGYFSPDSYQSHLGVAGVSTQLTKHYHGSLLVRGGMESLKSGGAFMSAWEIHAQNDLRFGPWTVELDYSKYHLAQDTGAFRANAGRFAVLYRF